MRPNQGVACMLNLFFHELLWEEYLKLTSLLIYSTTTLTCKISNKNIVCVPA